MSAINPELLERNTDGATTLAEAFGFPLDQLHIANEEGKELPQHVRRKVLADIL